ncbi:AcrR family transcriptional regulator [Mycolicibacterium sp. BK556]|uniref:TetR/AcrR family transcriptional regulator n=1 Tax=unclassified Mycolicibacterium TaxID=2636767 RepID=UPI001618020A|nr:MULTISPECIES: TetR/AcrR family transcriptional regulator [unclassified Mycolicibacterium]MBB3602639.1 AcrR family transcriptional regulator [Mycolicibacterium sp. BK556]MBB3632391.1 AcrR family transcriptional regulator [Mycolicibacterium sp. BK607]
MAQPLGRPRDASLDAAILDAARALLVESSYAELSMDAVAARARVGKKSIYRRWASKAPLVAEAVLDAYGRDGSFEVPDTGNLRADLLRWLVEHGEFITEPANAKLIRALVAAAAASSGDTEALYEQLSVPQRSGLVDRVRRAVDTGAVRADADSDAIANALMGTLLLQVMSAPIPNNHAFERYGALVDALLDGVSAAPDG